VAFITGGRKVQELKRDVIRLEPFGPTVFHGPGKLVLILAGGWRGLRLGDSGAGLAVSHGGRFIATAWTSERPWHPPVMPPQNNGWLTMRVQLWERSTGKAVWSREVEERHAAALALAPDGRTLVAGGTDGRLRFHDLRPQGWKPPGKWAEADFDGAWKLLGGEDAGKAYRAVWDLVSQGNESVRRLKKLLKPSTLDSARIKQRIDDLDSDTFEVRRAARKELEQIGEEAEGLLREAAGKSLPLEMKLSVERLLARLDKGPSSQRLRAGRALTVLARIGTPEARSLLEALGKGAEGAYLTQQARLAWAPLRFRR
jgi:hypothetical protein